MHNKDQLLLQGNGGRHSLFARDQGNISSSQHRTNAHRLPPPPQDISVQTMTSSAVLSSPSRGYIEDVILTYHLDSKAKGEAKVAILSSVPDGTAINLPIYYLTKAELRGKDSVFLMNRFIRNNEALGELCESEKADFDRTLEMWNETKTKPSGADPVWEVSRLAFYNSHLMQRMYYTEQQLISAVLREEHKIGVAIF